MRVGALIGVTGTGDTVVIRSVDTSIDEQRRLRKEIIQSKGTLPDGSKLDALYYLEPVKKNRFKAVEVPDVPKAKPKARSKRK